MMDELEGPSDWKKQREAVNKRLSEVAKKSGSEIAKKISTKKDAQSDKTIAKNCEVIDMLCHEAQSQMRDGKMDLKTVVKDLCEALEAMVGMKDDESKEEKE